MQSYLLYIQRPLNSGAVFLAGIIRTDHRWRAARSWHWPLHYVDWRLILIRLRYIAAIAHQGGAYICDVWISMSTDDSNNLPKLVHQNSDAGPCLQFDNVATLSNSETAPNVIDGHRSTK